MIDLVFFFNGPATTENYTYVHTLALPDALPISRRRLAGQADGRAGKADRKRPRRADEAVRLSLTREGRARRWRRQEGATSQPGSPRCGQGSPRLPARRGALRRPTPCSPSPTHTRPRP